MQTLTTCAENPYLFVNNNEELMRIKLYQYVHSQLIEELQLQSNPIPMGYWYFTTCNNNLSTKM